MWVGAASEQSKSLQDVSFVFKNLLPFCSWVFERLQAGGGGEEGKADRNFASGLASLLKATGSCMAASLPAPCRVSAPVLLLTPGSLMQALL